MNYREEYNFKMDDGRLENQSQLKRLLIQILLSVILGIISGIFLISIATLIYQKQYDGRIIPGVSVASIDLSTLTIEEASIKLNNQLNFPINGRIILNDSGKLWNVSPIELGLVVNTPESIRNAYKIGRTGSFIARSREQIRAYIDGMNISAIIMYDERVSKGYLQKLADEINTPVIEAELFLNGSSVISNNGKTGRLINYEESLESISNQLGAFIDGGVELVVEEIDPYILSVDYQAEILRKLLSSPIELLLPGQSPSDPGPWFIDPETAASIIKIERVLTEGKNEYSLGIYDSPISLLLEDIQNQVERSSQNARFIFNDDTMQLDIYQKAIIGRNLNIQESIQVMKNEFFTGNNVFTLVIDIEPPLVGDEALAKDLGITELVSTGITYFWGSSSERIQNIKTASERFHGLLIAPGETFSMGDALGDVSLENGYAEALIIYGNRTITGVGGGVCQVSTTLFRTVFLGGYPVVERHPHAYRVGYYELTYSGAKDSSLAGLDATVYVPLVDFKFTNDTPYWLLMETYVNTSDRRLTWKFYSTSDGRTVHWDTSGPQNIESAPDPLFTENPELGEMEMKQIDWSADGADVTITRTVYKNGTVHIFDEFRTSYQPWQAICQYGEGISNPEDKAEELGICQ